MHLQVLPLDLLAFRGGCDHGNTVLEWSTATETNNKYFTVQRSVAGIDWQVVGKVDGAGNSTFPHAYSMTDRLPGQSDHYYRIIQTDFDGNTRYGTVIAAEACGDGTTEKIAVYPNPSSGKLTLSYTGDWSQVYSTEIFDALGEKIYGSTGFQPDVDLTSRPSGMYFVQIRLNSKTIRQELILRK